MMLKMIKLPRITCIKGETVICEAVAMLVNFSIGFIYTAEHVFQRMTTRFVKQRCRRVHRTNAEVRRLSKHKNADHGQLEHEVT